MKKINESFVCINCGKSILPAERTCRNHCPFCFVSLHVDWGVPGDRSAECHGIMKPIDYKIQRGDIKILFQCEICDKQHWNKRAVDDDIDSLLTIVENYRLCQKKLLV